MDEVRIGVQCAFTLDKAARHVLGDGFGDIGDVVRLREHAAAETAIQQETINSLIAAHGDVRNRIDPKTRRVASAQAAVE